MKKVLLIYNEDKIILEQDDFAKLILEKNLNVHKIAEQEDFEVYKVITYKERSKLINKKSVKQHQKVFYISPIISENDLNVKAKKIDLLVSKGNQVKILLHSRKGRKLRKYTQKDLLEKKMKLEIMLTEFFQTRLIKISNVEFSVKKVL